MDAILEVGGRRFAPGDCERFSLPAALLPTHTQLNIPLFVANGMRPGPRLFLSAAVHGDEINGVEIIRQVLERMSYPLRRGSLIAVPIVNVFGFVGQSRYLPDRRDLNRSFPGSARGSLAARIANIFMTEIVSRCTHGIDLHTASSDKTNYPQVRGDMLDAETRRCAEGFAAPVTVHASVRTGSLRAAAVKQGLTILVYEGGEPLRFNPQVIERGVEGVLGVMNALDLIRYRRRRSRQRTIFVEDSSWIRARRGGLVRLQVAEGERVAGRQLLGTITDPFGEDGCDVRAPYPGLVIGRTTNPVMHGGDAVLHLARLPADAPDPPAVDSTETTGDPHETDVPPVAPSG